MLQSREEFEAASIARGILTAHDIRRFADEHPASLYATAEAIAALFVDRQQLTRFQADEILHQRPMPLVLNDYLVLDRLGAGNMGEVFKALHRRLERVVALKMVAATLTKSEVAVKRFQREVKAAARLSHPNIVTTYDAGEALGHHYLVMEYVDGSDLGKLKDGEQVPLDRALKLILQVAEGLEFAHANGVIHRDIKPANLLVDQSDRLRILDLGIARISQTLADDDGLTRTGYVMGTVDYMAPEQGFDIKNVDGRCDVYSLGCTLYRLITGQVMYAGDTFLERARRHEGDAIPSLRARCPHVPVELERVYRRLVAKKPRDRYPTMAAAKDALLHIQKTLATRAETLPHGSWWTFGFRRLSLQPAQNDSSGSEFPLATPMTPSAAPGPGPDTAARTMDLEPVAVGTLVPVVERLTTLEDTKSDVPKATDGTTPSQLGRLKVDAKTARSATNRRRIFVALAVVGPIVAMVVALASGLIPVESMQPMWLTNKSLMTDIKGTDAAEPIEADGNVKQVSANLPIGKDPDREISRAELISKSVSPNLLPEIVSPRLVSLAKQPTQVSLSMFSTGSQFEDPTRVEIPLPSSLFVSRAQILEKLPELSDERTSCSIKRSLTDAIPQLATNAQLPPKPITRTNLPAANPAPNPAQPPNNNQPRRPLGNVLPRLNPFRR